MIIAFLNQKGGSGKTTLATNFGAELQRRGRSVLLADCDPQGSARDWAAAREARQRFPVIGVDRPPLIGDLRALADDYDWILIDGAPQLADAAAAAISVADLVLIPVQPSPYDVWATADLVDTIRARQALADGRPQAAFVVSRQIKGTVLGVEIREALAAYNLPILQAGTTQRQIFARAAVDGLAACDLDPEGPAALEIAEIVNEVAENRDDEIG